MWGGVRSPAQSCQTQPRHNNNTAQSQHQQHNNSESGNIQGDIGEVYKDDNGISGQELDSLCLKKICTLSKPDICADKSASDEINVDNSSSASQKQSFNNSSSERSEKDNHSELLTTTLQPVKSFTTTSKNNSSTTRGQYEETGSITGRGDHFSSLRRLNSLLGILEQESERDMQAPTPAGRQAKVK